MFDKQYHVLSMKNQMIAHIRFPGDTPYNGLHGYWRVRNSRVEVDERVGKSFIKML